MLDDLKYIHQRDGQDALGVAQKQWQQLGHDFQLQEIGGSFSNIVYGGMGGSALAGYFSKSWTGHSLPFEVVRQYHIPKYVGPKTLYIASSYSGDTEEALSALAEAEAAGAKIVISASGGKMGSIAGAKSYPLAAIPANMQPRHAVLYQLKALIDILIAIKIVDKERCLSELNKAADFLKEAAQAWLPTIPEDKNPAKKLAMEIAGKAPAIYSGPLLSPAAYKWKINFNENSKNLAWSNEFSEFNHNEITGWSGHPIDKPYEVINLLSSYEHPRIRKRFELTSRLLSGRWPLAHDIEAQGSNILEHLLWTVMFGDFVSIYLALLNNVNPTPVELQEKFKLELNR